MIHSFSRLDHDLVLHAGHDYVPGALVSHEAFDSIGTVISTTKLTITVFWPKGYKGEFTIMMPGLKKMQVPAFTLKKAMSRSTIDDYADDDSEVQGDDGPI